MQSMLPPPAQPHVQTDHPQFEYLPPTFESEYRQPMPEPEEKKAVNQSPAKKRPGQTPVSQFIKAILRPIFKGIYYTIRWIRSHKLVSILAALLLIASILATSYFVAGTLPFSSSDSVATSIKNNPQLSPDVQNWLIALRSGDLNTMITIQKSMNPATRPPDSALYVMQFSEKYGGVKWTNASLMSIKTTPDGLVDSFVEIDMTQPTTTGTTAQVISLWHFATTQDGRIFLIDYVSSRSS